MTSLCRTNVQSVSVDEHMGACVQLIQSHTVLHSTSHTYQATRPPRTPNRGSRHPAHSHWEPLRQQLMCVTCLKSNELLCSEHVPLCQPLSGSAQATRHVPMIWLHETDVQWKREDGEDGLSHAPCPQQRGAREVGLRQAVFISHARQCVKCVALTNHTPGVCSPSRRVVSKMIICSRAASDSALALPRATAPAPTRRTADSMLPRTLVTSKPFFPRTRTWIRKKGC
jgi:hypothetical protein